MLINSVFTYAQDSPVLYKNSEFSTQERVDDLLSRMTLQEKIGQMTQLNINLINVTGKKSNVELDGEKARRYLKEYHIGSFLNGEGVPAIEWYNYIYDLQKIAIEETRLGIPIIYGIDHMHGASYLKGSTIFPHNINLAATFNPEHAYQTGRITAIESADLGHRWNFAPVLDLGRKPSWPRHYETFGESAHLASEMGRAYVNGYINNDEISPYKVAATGKHFLGYSVPESGWDRTPVHLSDQNIYEFHVPAFKAAIDAGMQTIMANSGEINGIPVHASKKFLTDLLRNELGFDGVIVTDWNDIGKLVNYHHTAKDFTQATEMAVNAGIDISMTPSSLKFNYSMMELVEAGKITEERINESVRRILTLKFDLGLFEHPYPRNDRLDRIGSPQNKEKARNAANESIVLLKNNESILPLSKSINNILLIGPSANKKAELSGGWTLSWQGASEDRYPEDMHTVYTALKAKFPNSNVTLLPFDAPKNELLSKAKKHDVIIAAIGEKPYTEFVGNITSLKLPEDQISLVKAATSTEVPVIGVFIGGRPRIVSDIIDSMHAYLWAGLPGFEGADAIADIISGDYNPSGKLPFSYPAYTGHFVPYNHKASDVYVFNASDANFIEQDEHSVWQWSYGFGLSYAEFTYSDLSVTKSEINDTEILTATVTVTNEGKRSGNEAVIWYLKDHVGTITRPVKEVKHFEKISLNPGESKVISFDINPCKDLGFPDFDGNYILETGNFSVLVDNQKVDFKLVTTNSPCSKN